MNSKEVKHEKTTVLYDDDCPVCRLSKEVALRFDRTDTLEFVGISSEKSSSFGFDKDVLNARIHAVSGDGTKTSGMKSVILILQRIPAFIPVVIGLKLIDIIGLGDICYDLFARNRHILGLTPGHR
ncbi:MAG: DUF393 domain-containing protein [Candidatus Thermoplasmatota archaeon]|nr:DUF393 domain-containing protein [Candidatus Thermoplasmatota archaeon]MCL5437831.1 DUF393 domain-containing protein [Candidatus Thermoplasmatota archaeon]